MKEGLPFPDNFLSIFGYRRVQKNEQKKPDWPSPSEILSMKPDWLIEEEEDRKRTYMLDEVMCTRDREEDEAEEPE